MLGNVKDKKSIFDKIDNYFANEKPSNLQMAYVGIACVIGYAVYNYVFPITDGGLKQTISNIEDVKNKINQENLYLSTHSRAALQKSKDQLASKKLAYDNTIYKMSYVDNKLTELSYLLFDDRSWANFVDNISDLAKKYNVDIKEISNKFYDPSNKKITHVAEVDVVSSATSKNMIKFLNAIEESRLVIDVSNIKMNRPKDMIEGSFKIAVWGMKYR
ncbi:MAG: hypothetical protein DSZ06_00815 [Sulfurospirillum sp.]|nr:MAG: hypothetical protein DSZ06_00815 [Sulfurospirillum sp.]